MQENKVRDMVNELRQLLDLYYQYGLINRKMDYGRMRTMVGKIVSKYIEVENG